MRFLLPYPGKFRQRMGLVELKQPDSKCLEDKEQVAKDLRDRIYPQDRTRNLRIG